jgi:hypothetical protein
MSQEFGPTGTGEDAGGASATSPTWVTLSEAARLGGVSVARVREWSRTSEIRAREDRKSARRRRPRRIVVALEDVLGRVEGPKPVDGERTSDELTRSRAIVVDRDELQNISKQLSDIQHTYDELMTGLEQAVTAESERDRLRDRVRELRRRVERLERTPPMELDAPVHPLAAPHEMAASRDDDEWASEVEDEWASEVDVEWRSEPGVEPSSRRGPRSRWLPSRADPRQPSP